MNNNICWPQDPDVLQAAIEAMDPVPPAEPMTPGELPRKVLRILRDLVEAVSNDVFTDAPERAKSVADAENAVAQAHELFRAVEATAWEILDNAEEAFAAMSLAQDRADNENRPCPQTIEDYLSLIVEEAEAQAYLAVNEDGDLVFAATWRDLAGELAALGYEPANP